MATKRYKFNPQTLTYELITLPFRIRFYRFLRQVLFAFLLASVINLLFSFFFYTPKMYQISKNANDLVLKYNVLQDKLRASTIQLNEIRQRDYTVYRSLFGTDTLDIQGIYTPYPEYKYEHLENNYYTPLVVDTWMELDAVARLTYLESKSLDELELLSLDKEKMADAIPAIWPVNRKNLRGRIGAFGMRFHPILRRWAGHTGIDLGGRIGDPVYATADGQVAFDNHGTTGYGKQIVLEHGFGYKTRYAHLNKILVIPGQRIKRGELIGELGNTGRSSGPHLHYEVIYRNVPVDPLNYFSRNMSEEEFTRIIESATETTYELD